METLENPSPYCFSLNLHQCPHSYEGDLAEDYEIPGEYKIMDEYNEWLNQKPLSTNFVYFKLHSCFPQICVHADNTVIFTHTGSMKPAQIATRYPPSLLTRSTGGMATRTPTTRYRPHTLKLVLVS